jgi:hypothetical protein
MKNKPKIWIKNCFFSNRFIIKGLTVNIIPKAKHTIESILKNL